MRILFLRTTEKISGAEIYNLNLLNSLGAYSDLQINLLTNSKLFVKKVNGLGIQSLYVPWLIKEVGTKKQLLRLIGRLPTFLLKCLLLIIALNREEQINLVCLQSMTEKIFLTPMLRLLKYKVIWIEHGPLYMSEMSRFIKWLYAKTSVFAQKIIAVSKDTKSDLVKGGVSSQKIEVIYIGVDTEKLRPLASKERLRMRGKIHIESWIKVIGFLGTVTKEKGIEDFLSISVQLIQRNQALKFLIIGDGPDLSWMKNQVKILKLDKYYHFVGFVEDIKKYLGIIDLFLFPTVHHEGISMAMLEAQSMEKVIVSRDIGGNSEIIQNKQNGYLYNQWNNERIGKDIVELVSDSKLLRKIGQEARKNVVTRFNISTQAKEFYCLFSTI